jgi:hypothetical protein
MLRQVLEGPSFEGQKNIPVSISFKKIQINFSNFFIHTESKSRFLERPVSCPNTLDLQNLTFCTTLFLLKTLG